MSVGVAIVELNKKVRERVKYGHPRHKILVEMIRAFGGELGEEAVTSEVNDIINGYANYNLIQMIMRGKIIKEASSRELFILDKKTRTVERITLENLLQILHPRLDVSDRIHTAIFRYEPHKMSQLYQGENGIWCYNKYVPPFWQADLFYDGVPIIPETELPELYRRYFMHLVDGDEASFNYILDWIAMALQSRNQCILTTIGSPGIGKGTLSYIFRELFGDKNSSLTTNGLIEGRFNAQLSNKRIVYVNEASVSKKREEEKLKTLVDKFLEIEKKGVDATTDENHSSFYFSSNSMDSIRISADDRRFSVINLTDKKLDTVMPIPEIKSLQHKVNIDKFARYMYFRKFDEARMHHPFISARTEEVRAAGLSNWSHWVLDEYAIDHAGQTVKVDKVSEAVEDKYGSRFRPSQKAFMELAKQYPTKLRVFKPIIGDRQVWAIKFPPKGESLEQE